MVRLARTATSHQCPIGPDHVSNVGEISSRLEISDPNRGVPGVLGASNAARKRRGDEHVALAGTEMVERSDSHHIEAVAEARLDTEHVGGGL